MQVSSEGEIVDDLLYRSNSTLASEVGSTEKLLDNAVKVEVSSYLQDMDLWEISKGTSGLDGKEIFQNEVRNI